MITKNILKKLIHDLDQELEINEKKYTITLIGASAIIAINDINRATIDIDIIDPEIDNALFKAAMNVSEKNGLEYNWLNSSATVFARELPLAWQRRTKIFYKGKYLTVKILGRKDLIITKLFAAIERPQRDFEDLLSLTPNKQELNFAKRHLLTKNDSRLFQERLQKIIGKLSLERHGKK